MDLKYFGTDGIRGEVGGQIINQQFFEDLGEALGAYLCRDLDPKDVYIAIGRDTRESGEVLEKSFVKGVSKWGGKIDLLGIIPTPGVSHYVIENGCSCGVVLTASHNPYTDNGIKFFEEKGSKFTKEKESEIEQLLSNKVISSNARKAIVNSVDGINEYITYIKSLFSSLSLNGLKIVLDTANGATCKSSKEVLDSLGAKVIQIGDRADGRNINVDCGSQHPEHISQLVKKEGADIGIAHDGDGDRVVVCDGNGDVINGDKILGLLAIDALEKNKLSNNTLVATIHSNSGLEKSLKQYGIKVVYSDIGDCNVFIDMNKLGANIGGESSGHIILRDLAETGDGLISALSVLAIKKKVSICNKLITLYPSMENSVVVKEKIPLKSLQTFQKALHAIREKQKKEGGNVLARYSGTENKIRVLVEGKDEESMHVYMKQLQDALKADKLIS